MKSFKKGATSLCSVFGPTCDALDVVSMAENLPNLERGDFVYSVNIGAYSHDVPEFTAANAVLLTGQPGLGVSNGLASASADASVYGSSWEGSILAPA